MDYTETTDDEEAEAKYFENLYYVDTQTVESPQENTPLTPSNNQTKQFLSRRYWSKGLDCNKTGSTQFNNAFQLINTPNKRVDLPKNNNHSSNLNNKNDALNKIISDDIISKNNNLSKNSGQAVKSFNKIEPMKNNNEPSISARINISDAKSNNSNNNKMEKANKNDHHNNSIDKNNKNDNDGKKIVNNNANSLSLIERLVVPVPFNKNSNKNVSYKQNSSRNIIIEDSDDSNEKEVTIIIPNYGLHKPVSKLNDTKTTSNKNNIVNKTFPINEHHKLPDISVVSDEVVINIPDKTMEKVIKDKIIDSNMMNKNNKKIKSSNLKKNVSIDKNQVNEIIVLDVSDSESVVEVEIKKPTQTAICIDSSDDEESLTKAKSALNTSKPTKQAVTKGNSSKSNIPICVSPVPSFVSTASDDFIQSDCTHLNISFKDDSTFLFDFKLHGTDFANDVSINDINSIKKTSVKDNIITSTPVQVRNNVTNAKRTNATDSNVSAKNEDVFVTPKNKGKRKREPKNYTLPSESLIAPFADIYDSESSDVPESVVDFAINPTLIKKRKTQPIKPTEVTAVPDTMIMANVVGINVPSPKQPKTINFDANCDAGANNTSEELPAFVRKHIENKFSKSTEEECIQEMEQFYNESWGGENFDFNKIKMSMPSDKDLWKIDIADKLTSNRPPKKLACHICHKQGHKEERCHLKIKKCHMCGEEGHAMNKCRQKICLNCGSRNNDFSSKCRKCNNWNRIKCSICHIFGHPTSNCPDLWRRYHLTHKNEIPLVSFSGKKSNSELYCSACAKKGHTASECMSCNDRYKIASPYICLYTPSYTPDGVRDSSCNMWDSTSSVSNSIKENITPANNGSDQLLINRKKKSTSKCPETPNKKIRLNDDSQDVIICDSPSIIVDDSLIVTENNDCSQMLLTPEFYTKLVSAKGMIHLKSLSDKYKVDFTLESSLQGEVLLLNGIEENRVKFQTDIQAFLISADLYHMFQFNLHALVPRIRSMAIKKMTTDLELLNKNLGNPNDLHSSFKELEEKYKCSSQSKIVNMRSNIFIFKEMSDKCQALNMILLGQAGFTEGKDHVRTLRDGFNTIKNLSSKYLNHNMKYTLGKSYSVIFSPVPRKDYAELIDRFMKRPELNLNEQDLRNVLKKSTIQSFGPKASVNPFKKNKPNISDPFGGYSVKTSYKKIFKALQRIRSKFSIAAVKPNTMHTKYAQETVKSINKHLFSLTNSGLTPDLFSDIKDFSSQVHRYIRANRDYF